MPTKVENDLRLQKNDFRTTHEEVDVIIVQQMVKAVDRGHMLIKVISGDTCFYSAVSSLPQMQHASCCGGRIAEPTE